MRTTYTVETNAATMNNPIWTFESLHKSMERAKIRANYLMELNREVRVLTRGAVDSAGNRVIVEDYLSGYMVIVRLEEDRERGYIAIDGEFGDETCPQGPNVLTWFGVGERFATVDDAWEACLQAIVS